MGAGLLPEQSPAVPREPSLGLTAWSVAALAGATLVLETTLLRLLSVAQFYHFAFLVVSLALLGFGASGSLLSVSDRLQRVPLSRLLPLAGLAFSASTLLAYATVNWLPFDSYSIAWDRRQVLFFALYYLALTLPFLGSGLGIGAALAATRGHSHLVYAANLVGSGAGAALALGVLEYTGVPGGLLVAFLLGLMPLAASRWRQALLFLTLLGLVSLAGLALLNARGRAPLALTISPYKGLAYARQYPGARHLFGAWNAVARVDVMASAGVRRWPGLSYAYSGSLPPQHGLFLDADAPQPITLATPEALKVASFLPEQPAFALRPGAAVLVLRAGGGLGVLQALASGAGSVTAVVENPIVVRAVEATAPEVNVYGHPRVRLVLSSARTFLQQDTAHYDVVFMPLTDAYRPVTGGAYSLAETYHLTVEALAAALDRLAPGGIFVATRWAQVPPSESVRFVATVVEALERRGVPSAARALVVYRGVQTLTVLVRPEGWTSEELALVRRFAEERRYDLVWAPDIRPEEVNRYNRLPTPAYYEVVRRLLTAPDRRAVYAASAFDISPPTDNRPFFLHFFTWQQAPEVLATLGKTWEPFGGSGYFVLLALLALVSGLGAALILAPLWGRHLRYQSAEGRWVVAYFTLLGLAFLFVEIPLIQRAILWLGHPTYAFAAVVGWLLVASGVGSAVARRPRLPRGAVWLALPLLAAGTPVLLDWLTPLALRAGAGGRLLLLAGTTAPLGVVLGIPFPVGLMWLEREAAPLVPWAWAINGAASVVAAVLAAILALELGFTAVLWLGAAAYLGAGLIWWHQGKHRPPAPTADQRGERHQVPAVRRALSSSRVR